MSLSSQQLQDIIDSQAEILKNSVLEGEIADKKVKHFNPKDVIEATKALNELSDSTSPFLGITMKKV